MDKLVIPEGYKQTEVGVIPEEWDLQLFSKLTDTITCGVAATPDYVAESVGKPFLSAQNVRKGKVDYTKHNFISAPLFEQLTKHNKPKKRDILYTRVGAGIGEAAVIPDNFEFAIYVSLTLIKVKHGVLNPYFTAHLLNSDKFRFLAKNGQFAGGGVQNLNVEVVRSFLIPLPPYNEQTAIANALSDVDALIAELEKLIAKKQAIKTATMQQLLTGRTRLPEFANYPDGTPKGYKQTELGEIPEGWNVISLGDVMSIRHGKNQKQVEAINGKYPILATGGQIGWADSYIYDKPSVLIGRKGTIDKPRYAETPFWTVDTLFYSEIDSIADPKFIFYKFCMVDWMQYNEASGVPSLNAATIEKVLATVPSKVEQTVIANILSDMDKEIHSLQQRFDKTRRIKQGMMQELLTGKTRLV